MLVIVFCKMEIRRMGYLVWKKARAERLAQDTKRLYSLKFAKLIRPERIEKYAKSYLALTKANEKQIIQMHSAKVSIGN